MSNVPPGNYPPNEPNWDPMSSPPSGPPPPPPSQPPQQPPQPPPGGYQQPPGFSGPPPGVAPGFNVGGTPLPPPKKKKVWPWIVFPLLFVFLLCGGGCGALVFFGVKEGKKPIDATNNFLSAVSKTDYPTAAEFTCERYASQDGVIAIIAPIIGTSQITKYNVDQVHVGDSVPGSGIGATDPGMGEKARTGAKITLSSGENGRVTFILVKESGDYKVCAAMTGDYVNDAGGS